MATKIMHPRISTVNHTVLLPVANSCPYNQCAFCSMYKDEKYQEVPLQEIEQQLMNGDPYTERVFLTGADPLAVGYERMLRILKLKEIFSLLWMCGSLCFCEKS